jgi:hypothetical protein
MSKSSPSDPNTGANPNCPIDETTKSCAAVPPGCEYLNKPYTVEAPQADFDRIRGTSTLGPPKDIKHTFPGDSSPQDAIEQEVDVKGHKVKVITPKSGAPAGKNLPTADQIAKSLAAVPDDQLTVSRRSRSAPIRIPVTPIGQRRTTLQISLPPRVAETRA